MAMTARAMARKLDVAPARLSRWQAAAGGLDGPPSATSPAPRGWRHRETGGGVGLGILAALVEGHPPSPSAAAAARASNAIASPRRAVRLEVSELGCSGRCAGISLCGAGEAFRVAEFLACCDLCRRRLDGKDIFMYRGERAFCSTECRYQAIVREEDKERKRRAVRLGSDAEMPGSPCAAGSAQIFFTGITVT